MTTEVTLLARGHRRPVDCTAGGGGHTAALLGEAAAVVGEEAARVLALDRDPAALEAVRARFNPGAVQIVEGFFDGPAALAQVRSFRPDFIVLDLGVSSHQLDDPARGFSFRPGTTLDMRMSPSVERCASDILNLAPEPELTRMLHEGADERRARRLAGEISRRRAHAPFRTSDHLVNAVRAVLGPRSGPRDFARIFQAIRIAVNDELGRLERALPLLREALTSRGTLAVITYHSGEDRIVKTLFRDWCRSCVCPPTQPVCTCRGRPLGSLVHRRPVTPSAEEVLSNPRARSAKLRAFRTADVG